MKVFHVLIFQKGETEGKTLFTAAIAENHNIAAHKVITEDKRVERDKIEFVMVLDDEGIKGHLEEVGKLIKVGKTLAANHSSLLMGDMTVAN